MRNLFYIDIHIIREDKFSPCSGVRYSRTGHMTPTSSPQIKKQKNIIMFSENCHYEKVLQRKHMQVSGQLGKRDISASNMKICGLIRYRTQNRISVSPTCC